MAEESELVHLVRGEPAGDIRLSSDRCKKMNYFEKFADALSEMGQNIISFSQYECVDLQEGDNHIVVLFRNPTDTIFDMGTRQYQLKVLINPLIENKPEDLALEAYGILTKPYSPYQGLTEPSNEVELTFDFSQEE